MIYSLLNYRLYYLCLFQFLIMSNSTNDLVTNLNNGVLWINRIVPVVQLVLGTFGNLFNIIIFTRRSLRNNPCSMYFLAASISNCFELYLVVLPPYLLNNWHWDPATTNVVWCAIRAFIYYPSVCLVLWFIVLSSYDRFLSSSHSARMRQLSSLPIARKVIISTIILFFLMYVHTLVFYRLIPSGSTSTCNISGAAYITFFNILFLMLACVLPIILMSIFGILTIRNVRKLHNRVAPQANDARNERLRSSDRQLIRMLLFQVLITTLISTPYCCVVMYSTFALTVFKYQLSTLGLAIFLFTAALTRALYLFNSVAGFYIYTLNGPKFRTEMKRCSRHGLKLVLTTTGLMRCLSLEAQQALLRENQVGANNESMTAARGGNTVHPIQQQEPIVMTTAV
jgi:hypothetical protein